MALLEDYTDALVYNLVTATAIANDLRTSPKWLELEASIKAAVECYEKLKSAYGPKECEHRWIMPYPTSEHERCAMCGEHAIHELGTIR